MIKSKQCASLDMRDPKTLKPYKNNARKHPAKQIDQICESIKKFGFNAPILIDSDDKIVAGHGRLAAALKLQLEEVPVVILQHLTEKQRAAYIIADNRLAQNAEWDMGLLKEELLLIQADFDPEILGFSQADIDLIFGKQENNPDSNLDDDSNGAVEEYKFEVTCDSANQRRKLIGELQERGINCKAKK